jgi:predicted permease
MTTMRQLLRRIRFFFRRAQVERDMSEEMHFHLEMRTMDRVADGLPAEEARYAAQKLFGNLGVIQGDSRDLLSFTWIDQLTQDLRYSLRSLKRNPGYTLVALVTLALGIGANTTAFTVLNRLLLRQVPFKDTSRLVNIGSTWTDGSKGALSSADFLDLRAQNTVFAHFAMYWTSWLATLAEPGQPATRCDSMGVTADFFPAMGIEPVMLGRTFTKDDEARKEHLALLSHGFWLRHYGADPNVLGRIIRSDGGMEYTIIGVMIPAMDDPTLFGAIRDGVAFCTLITDLDPIYRERGWNSTVARLKPGVSPAQAQAELDLIAHRLEHDYPKTNTGRGFRLDPFPTNSLDKDGVRLVWLVMCLSGVVLLVACVNLANLQLVRTTGRRNEFGIRLALGSTRGRLIRMLLTESMVISVAGGILGLLIAHWSNRYLAAYWNVDMPLNLRVIGFTFMVSAASGAVFGIMPALLASRSELNASMKQAARGATPDRLRHRLRNALIVAELAMALTLLAGAGYFVRGIQRITRRELGWRPENVVMGYLALDHDHYGEARDARSLAFTDRIVPELEKLPGVDAVGISNDNVFDVWPSNFEIEGRPPYEKGVLASFETPSPGYFKAYGMHILEGRDFNGGDRPGKLNVAIVSSDLARRYWPGESAVGKRIGIEDPAHQKWAVVVGVVNNILHDREWDPAPSRLAIYYPWAQNSFRYLAITVHSAGNPEDLKEEMRKTMGRIEPNIAFSYLDTAENMMGEDLLQYTLARRMLVQVAGLGLLLAAVGIYGVIANLASERTREIGIRMALGAQSRDVIWLFLRSGIRLAFVGTLVGLAGSFGLMRLLGHLVSGFPGSDPWIVIGIATVLVAVALIACWLPARGATKVSPIQALRAD